MQPPTRTDDRLTVADASDGAAEAYLAAIAGSSDDAIIAKDLDGLIQWCNAAAERIFGYSSAELVGRPVRILIPADRQFEEDTILACVRRGERIEHFDTVRVAKDGTPLNVSLTVSPVSNRSGTIIGVSKTARDITAQKRATAEATERQMAAAERERLLELERLGRAEAERASHAKDEFVAMHDLARASNAAQRDSWLDAIDDLEPSTAGHH